MPGPRLAAASRDACVRAMCRRVIRTHEPAAGGMVSNTGLAVRGVKHLLFIERCARACWLPGFRGPPISCIRCAGGCREAHAHVNLNQSLIILETDIILID